jgi:hypothetical protein
MNRKDLIFAGIALSVIALFVFLSMSGRHGKELVGRPEHAGITRDTPRETCWSCHAPDATVAPMPVRHPKKGKPPDQTTPCYVCHKLPEGLPAKAASVSKTNQREGLIKWQSQLQK